MANKWYVYMLRCADDSLYTGVATDLERRLREHNSTTRMAARYTRARQPVKLVYSEEHANRSLAQQREYQIKQLSRAQKEAMLDNKSPNA